MPPADPARPLDGIPLLLVEDDAVVRRTAMIVLRGLGGVTVAECHDGDAFARHCAPGLRDVLVFTDLHMPGADPIDVLTALPETDRPRGVVILSGDAGTLVSAQHERLRAAGLTVLGTIEKPMSPAKLRPLLLLLDQG